MIQTMVTTLGVGLCVTGVYFWLACAYMRRQARREQQRRKASVTERMNRYVGVGKSQAIRVRTDALPAVEQHQFSPEEWEAIQRHNAMSYGWRNN